MLHCIRGISSQVVSLNTLYSTTRLYLLVQILASIDSKLTPLAKSVAEFTGAMSQEERNKLIRLFKSGKIKVQRRLVPSNILQAIICSDVMSRGLDIDDVGSVINYDVPVFIKSYVHRVGRTARAGREGKTYTIAKNAEVRHFKEILSKAENSHQLNTPVNETQIKEWSKDYKVC